MILGVQSMSLFNLQVSSDLTDNFIPITADETCRELSLYEFVDFLRTEIGFRNIEIIGRSVDFNRPIIRCLRNKS